MTSQGPRTEAVPHLLDAVRIILINEVPSDEAWKELEAAYDEAMAEAAALPADKPEPSVQAQPAGLDVEAEADIAAYAEWRRDPNRVTADDLSSRCSRKGEPND